MGEEDLESKDMEISPCFSQTSIPREVAGWLEESEPFLVLKILSISPALYMPLPHFWELLGAPWQSTQPKSALSCIPQRILCRCASWRPYNGHGKPTFLNSSRTLGKGQTPQNIVQKHPLKGIELKSWPACGNHDQVLLFPFKNKI